MVQDVLRLLLDYEAKIDALRRRSNTVVPVHLRKLPVTSQLRVVALVDCRLSDQVIYQVQLLTFWFSLDFKGEKSTGRRKRRYNTIIF